MRLVRLYSTGNPCPASCRPTWIDVAGERILLYESIAEDKSTANAIATRLWRCALGTAAWLGEQAHVFDEQTVLEVGAGTGLCSMVLAATSTARVIASDLDHTAVELVRAAADHQALQLDGVLAFDLDSDKLLPEAQWLIACDVMYTPSLAVALARRCAEQLMRGGHVLVTDPDRPPRVAFQAELDRRLGQPTNFVRLQEASPLDEMVRAAVCDGRGAALVLLLVDERCRPPFSGGAPSRETGQAVRAPGATESPLITETAQPFAQGRDSPSRTLI